MAQRHISLSISFFLVIYANTFKSNLECNIILKERKLKTILSHIGFGIFGSLLPPFGLFSQKNLFPISISKHLFWQIKRSFKSKFDQMPQTPPFSHNENSPP
jgi:hypothetical protein